MRVIHTADWHLGQELHGFARGHEHALFLDWLAAQLREREADALVVAGDVFDTSNPPVSAQRQLYRFLARVLRESVRLQVVIVGGNHDSAARIELPGSLLDDARLVLVGGMPRRDGQPDPDGVLRVLSDRDGAPALCCAAVPYLRPGDVPSVADGTAAVGALYAAVVAAARDRAAGLPILVTGHLNVAGCTISDLSERRIVVGGEEAVEAAVFPPGVAYTALGHLHRPQSVGGAATIHYAGSPFPMASTEAPYAHSVVQVDFDVAGVSALERVEVPRPVDFVRVPAHGAGSPDEVVAAVRALPPVDPGDERRPFLEVVVRLDAPEPALRQRLDDALAGKAYRLTRVKREVIEDGAANGTRDAALTLNDLRPEEVFRRCHLQQHGSEPSDELLRAFALVLADAGTPQEENA